MGRVAASYNLMPEGPEVPVDEVRERIASIVPENVTVSDAQIKPLAFGLKIIQVTFIMDDAEGIVDRLEETLQGLEGIQNVETISITLI